MPWLQLIVETPRADIANIESCLINAGAVSVTFQEHVPNGESEKPILEPALGKTPLWNSSRLTGLFDAGCDTSRIDDLLAQQMSPLPTFRWEQLEDKDWEREWMDNYHPIQCANNLWICPSWKTPPDLKATNLLLDPGLAFGTGTHPTTFLCLQWLAGQDFEGKDIVDYGCGSGILGIAALLLGAKKVTGIDIDPQALTATHENVTRNNIDKARFPVYLPGAFKKLSNSTTAKLEHTHQADLVIANILAGPLVELTRTLTTHVRVGGAICLSGILAAQAETVMRAYSKHINFEVAAEKEGWVRLAGSRYQ